ncbi:MAG: aryl-sulfate sulfotransferase [Bacteroidia bacterium]|nr:aryl-sulfate sulfotransferase [Bacteroidia bacterium]NND11859.1 aryl-sulfate sulfotransferase [Flavobacteriaceae bacterium]MBT8309151.1 aryl-sulfate sulfotransferase [Bacteroidia bacterium]NNK28238.1 aryl-sulfate sulfotransferase [Flavobacteriaceae bacterium]NNL61159.1 aryl-sulfate sulfotransferase [Flavobacteriaceae bacterium]
MIIRKLNHLCFQIPLTFLLTFNFSCDKADFDHTSEINLNPYNIAPLTALVKVEASVPCTASIEVLGISPVKQDFSKNAKNLEIPIVGLYPDTENKVVLTLTSEKGKVIDTLIIKTGPLPNSLPNIVVNTLNRNDMKEGFHGCDTHFANHGKFHSMPIIFDDQGIIRWYLDLGFNGKMVSPFQRLKDGTLLMVDRDDVFEFDMLGKLLKKTNIGSNYGMHHDVLELPNGDLLICIGKRNQKINLGGEIINSDSDFMMHYDRKNGKIVKEWDLAKHLDVNRNDMNFFKGGDWLHMNALEFDERDSTIIVSARNQGLIKVTWDDKLKWIMAPKQNWGRSGRFGNGYDTRPYLLTAVNKKGNAYNDAIQNGIQSAEDFDFPWAPHAPELLPNGNIIAFDNGAYRNFNNDNNYSRGAEYKVDEENMTVTQIWEYGKNLKEAFFSTIISDVDFHPGTNNILITSGFLYPATNHSAKIVEVDYETGKETFEATLFFKNLGSDGKPGWGQKDILYRSERMDLKY